MGIHTHRSNWSPGVAACSAGARAVLWRRGQGLGPATAGPLHIEGPADSSILASTSRVCGSGATLTRRSSETAE